MANEAQLTWTTQGLQFVARAGEGPAIVLDNPEGASGPTPMELLLMGIAGCTGMDVVSILKKKRSGFTGMSIHITGERTTDHPMRYTHLHIAFQLTGPDIKPGDVQRAIELSVTKYCSAIASVNATVEYTYGINE